MLISVSKSETSYQYAIRENILYIEEHTVSPISLVNFYTVIRYKNGQDFLEIEDRFRV